MIAGRQTRPACLRQGQSPNARQDRAKQVPSKAGFKLAGAQIPQAELAKLTKNVPEGVMTGPCTRPSCDGYRCLAALRQGRGSRSTPLRTSTEPTLWPDWPEAFKELDGANALIRWAKVVAASTPAARHLPHLAA